MSKASIAGSEFAGHHQPKQVGTAARGVHLVVGDHVAGAHRAAFGLAAGADAGAHLDGSCEAPLPRKVEHRVDRLVRVIVRADAEVVSGVGVADDLAGIEQVFRVESVA